MVAKKKIVVVKEYDPAWPLEFEKIRAAIQPAIGGLQARVEHVGSTSVPELAAKPIIDLDIVLKHATDFETLKAGLEGLGYIHVGDRGVPGREAFSQPESTSLMRHHLYVLVKGALEQKRHLALRDHLREHAADREAYARIKREGAALHPDDIDAYIIHKGAFIQSIYRRYGLAAPDSMLINFYAIAPTRLTPTRGGWSAEAWEVESPQGQFFLKAYAKDRDYTARYLPRLGAYLDLLAWLQGKPALAPHLPQPIRTLNGRMTAEDDLNVYVLFSWIAGPNLGEEPLTKDKAAELGSLLGALHALRVTDIPVALRDEGLGIDFVPDAFAALEQAGRASGELGRILKAYEARVRTGLNQLVEFSRKVGAQTQGKCFCHRDLHGWNLMKRHDALVLIDWEDAGLSYPEDDLSRMADEPQFPTLMQAYQTVRPGFAPDQALMWWFKLRRTSVDIYEFTRQLQTETLPAEAEQDALFWLERSCVELDRLLTVQPPAGG